MLCLLSLPAMWPAQALAATPGASATLCAAAEQVVLSCMTGVRWLSLCASADFDGEQGYLQYRYGVPGRIELEFPRQRSEWRRRIRASVNHPTNDDGSKGVAGEIEFAQGSYAYRVEYLLDAGQPSGGVTVSKASRQVAEHDCAPASIRADSFDLLNRIPPP